MSYANSETGSNISENCSLIQFFVPRHASLRRAAELMEGRIGHPLLVQGSAPRSELLRRFRQLGDAVLSDTGSFWEGVDLRGEVLSCVIIDESPFASPDDPALKARI